MEFPGFIGVRVRPQERKVLEDMAEREHSTLSAVIRRALVREAQRSLLDAAAPKDGHDAV